MMMTMIMIIELKTIDMMGVELPVLQRPRLRIRCVIFGSAFCFFQTDVFCFFPFLVFYECFTFTPTQSKTNATHYSNFIRDSQLFTNVLF